MIRLSLKLLLFLSACLSRQGLGKDLPLLTPSGIGISVQWQMIRSRSQSMLAGTLTESYAARWIFSEQRGVLTTQDPAGEAVYPTWTVDQKDSVRATLMMTRGDLVRLLGIQQELPQDGRLWQAEGPVFVAVQSSGSRASAPVFRFADDNGTLVIRLSARLSESVK